MKLVELFCGAGGMSLGFKRAGFTILRGYDYWQPALDIHEANLGSLLRKVNGYKKTRQANLGRFDGEAPELGDILTIIPEILELAPDIIVGGPPCQPWSSAGQRKGEEDERAKLTDAFAYIVALVKPKYFVMENVQGLQRYAIFKRITAILRNAGYGLTEQVLDASQYGVAQKRKRLILAGCLGEADGWLLDHLDAAKSPKQMTVADVLGPDFGRIYFRRGHNEGERRSLWSSAEPAPSITSTFRRSAGDAGYALREADIRVLDTLNEAELQETCRLFWLMPGGMSSAGTRRTDQPAPTISHGVRERPGASYRPKESDVIELDKLPIPTFEQLALIGGFPASWDWSPVKSESARMQALANAVPPPLAASVGRCIMAHSKGERPAVIDMTVPKPFVTWLRRNKPMDQGRRKQILSEFKAVQQLVGQRKFADVDAALSFLETVPEFKALGTTRKSNLRSALRLYAECDADLNR
ncbi:DNA cytosine methyltransferase [Microvirga sp. CF3062]|uniref:DNA cytosine methyltransferase n=1 Tax=Microvirga sp. CF3062 TaxID=3110182 RepID=UPI002E785A7D|nr:DNA cytosine methyltransferase [Microvirga sp. CF3062]MEE1657893.1 DNA cytosine methyltransferase [Microvirga sp. CF3062]